MLQLTAEDAEIAGRQIVRTMGLHQERAPYTQCSLISFTYLRMADLHRDLVTRQFYGYHDSIYRDRCHIALRHVHPPKKPLFEAAEDERPS